MLTCVATSAQHMARSKPRLIMDTSRSLAKNGSADIALKPTRTTDASRSGRYGTSDLIH